jgi:DNA polymerase elongation subunit (family B)
MEGLQAEEDRLDQELEDSHGEYEKMKTVFERRIQLYKRFLKKEGLTELDRLRLENKKEWAMSHLLSLIMREETTNKFSELTKRIYRLEKKTAELPEY